jgi:hypothetical protein
VCINCMRSPTRSKFNHPVIRSYATDESCIASSQVDNIALLKLINEKNNITWRSVIYCLPKGVLKFAINASMDTLPSFTKFTCGARCHRTNAHDVGTKEHSITSLITRDVVVVHLATQLHLKTYYGSYKIWSRQQPLCIL